MSENGAPNARRTAFLAGGWAFSPRAFEGRPSRACLGETDGWRYPGRARDERRHWRIRPELVAGSIPVSPRLGMVLKKLTSLYRVFNCKATTHETCFPAAAPI